MFYKIDLVNIDEGRGKDERFLPVFERLQNRLNIPGMIDFICLHEGGHLAYSRLEKLRTTLHGPTIEYVTAADEFVHVDGAVGHPDIDRNTHFTARLLYRLARVGLAPNLFTDVFLRDCGENSALKEAVEKDRKIVYDNECDEFRKRCKWALRSGVTFSPNDYLRRAKESIEPHINSPEMLDKIKQASLEIRPLFVDLSHLLPSPRVS